MPSYRIHIKLDEQEVLKFTLYDPKKYIDLVYLDVWFNNYIGIITFFALKK